MRHPFAGWNKHPLLCPRNRPRLCAIGESRTFASSPECVRLVARVAALVVVLTRRGSSQEAAFQGGVAAGALRALGAWRFVCDWPGRPDARRPTAWAGRLWQRPNDACQLCDHGQTPGCRTSRAPRCKGNQAGIGSGLPASSFTTILPYIGMSRRTILGGPCDGVSERHQGRDC